MLIDLTEEILARCERVTPRRQLMLTQLMPGTVLYAEPNKSKLYRPHKTHRGKATVFLWEPTKFDQDFGPAVGLSASEPLVMADEDNGKPEPPVPPPPPPEEPKAEEPKAEEPKPEPTPEPKAEESAPSTGVDDVGETSAPPSGDEPSKPVAE
jgi:hypothetical protein